MAQAVWDRLLGDLRSVVYDLDRGVAAAAEVGRLRQAAHLPFLRRLLRDDLSFVREAAAAPYAASAWIKALPLLLEAHIRGIAAGQDNDGLDAVLTDLVEAHPATMAPLLLRMLRKRSASARAAAAWLLGYVAGQVSPEPLLRRLRDRSAEVRAAVAGALSSFPGQPGVLEGLARLARVDEDRDVRQAAIAALGELGDRGALPTLRSILQDPAGEDRAAVRLALARLER